MKMTRSLLTFARRRLHTIISRELIKPSSPTPSNLKTYNLSLLDQSAINSYVPMVLFYPNTAGIYPSSDAKTLGLKNSLSQTLTKYYPFAGRHVKYAPAHVDCNDEGAEFFEASIDSTLSDFLQKSQHEDLDQFFPYRRLWVKMNHEKQSDKAIPLAVQINHFACGGVAVALSLSHKIADGTSLVHFITDWAKTTRFCSREHNKCELPIDPRFISFPYNNINFGGLSVERSNECVIRSFMFPNSKLKELKLKVEALAAQTEQPITNPTRVEVLNWLLFKCAVAAATKNSSGSFKPTGIQHPVNIRSKMMEQLPETSIGNFFMIMEIPTNNERDTKPESFINEIKKQKMKIRGLRNIESVFDILSAMSSETTFEEQQTKLDNVYICTGLCGFPLYETDFGWGKPVKITFGGKLKNSILLLDAANGDGIEAIVCLGKPDMDIFQNDPELLAFC